MPYLSDIGRETAEKAERLFAFINSRFLGEVAIPRNPGAEFLRSGQLDPESRPSQRLHAKELVDS
jgi:hypothetical protein